MSRSTRAEVNARVLAVLELRLDGAELADLRRHASDLGWNVCDRQLERYAAEADALCKRHFDAEADHLLARHCLQRRRLYRLALGSGDLRAALAALQDEAKLEGLYHPQRHELSGPEGRPIEHEAKVTHDLLPSPEAIRAYLATVMDPAAPDRFRGEGDADLEGDATGDHPPAE